MRTEAEAFLQRIRAFPDDDAPRLVFADWLEENGAGAGPGGGWGIARARFIRVQIALAHLEEEDRAAGDDSTGRAAREEVRARQLVHERRLLDAHREEWIAPLQGLATGPRFRRGFVEEVNVVARQFVRHDHELFRTGPVRHIHVIELGGSLPAVFRSAYLSRLAALTVHGLHTGEPLARAVAGCEHLAGLKRLHLTRNRFDAGAAELLAGSPALAAVEDLDLSENELGEAAAWVLASSAHFRAVRRLELRGNRLGPAGAEALAGSERLVSLHRLGVAENEVGGGRLLSLNRIHDLLRVPELDLSKNGLTPAGLEKIFARPVGPAAVRLRELDLSRNEQLGDDGARLLAACPALGGLRGLRLAWCGIGDDGARVLAESPHLNRLVHLDLGNNPISDPGFRAFLEPSHLRALRQLVVPGYGVSDRMRKALNGRFHEGR